MRKTNVDLGWIGEKLASLLVNHKIICQYVRSAHQHSFCRIVIRSWLPRSTSEAVEWLLWWMHMLWGHRWMFRKRAIASASNLSSLPEVSGYRGHVVVKLVSSPPLTPISNARMGLGSDPKKITKKSFLRRMFTTHYLGRIERLWRDIEPCNDINWVGLS